MPKHPFTLALAVLCLFSGTAWAHTGGHSASGFVSGLTHPLQGGAGGALPQVETVVALSALALGLLVATRGRTPLLAGMTIAAAFALFHGYAHALEMPLAASPVRYAIGFVLATIGLHGAGIAAGLCCRHAVRLAGAGIAAAGMAWVLGA